MAGAERYREGIKSCEEQLKKLRAQREEAVVMPTGVARDHVMNYLRSEIAQVEGELETFQWALSRE